MFDRPPAAATATMPAPAAPAALLPGLPDQESDESALISLDLLKPADSPRLDGLDSRHAQVLAEIEVRLPPILVRRSTMRVIDGMHRLDAARRQAPEQGLHLARRIGRDGRFRPLSSAEGRRAASELFAAHPESSLRQI